jgi:hypothetical protein
MNDTTTSENVLNFAEDKPKLPSSLNTLTILTFIGCAMDLYGGIKNFFGGEASLAKIKDAQNSIDQMPSWARRFVSPEVLEMTQKSIDNKVPLLIISLLSISLCVFGALEMRKLKKQGYILWLTGELLPIAGSIIFIGAIIFKTTFVFFMIFPLIFIILYTSQKKYLTK